LLSQQRILRRICSTDYVARVLIRHFDAFAGYTAEMKVRDFVWYG
jgi:hypothetical protein